MKPWQRIAIFTAGLAALVGGGIAIAAATGTSSGIGTTSTTSTTSTSVTTTTIGGGTPCQFCSYYARFSNGIPSVNTFFPIEIFDAIPTGGNAPPYANEGQAEHAIGMNMEDGNDGVWPGSYGVDTGGMLCNAKTDGIYVLGGYNVGTAAPGAKNSAASILAAANSSGCGSALAGYDVGDEGCSRAIGSQVAAVHAVDPTRIANIGQAGFFGPAGEDSSAGCITALNASDINSGDVYEITNPYIGSVCNPSGGQGDCLWGYGVQTARMVYHDTANHPTFVDLETGSDNAGQSESGGACNSSTNLCPHGNEQRATSEQVNSAAWETLINGANGIIWFCFDSQTAPGATPCLGGSPAGSATVGEPANLTYIDGLIKSYAVPLNAPNDGYCRMISDHIGSNASFAPPYTTCAGGDLTVSTSNTNEPVVAMTRKVGSTIYLFTMADHGSGSTSATYTLSDATGGGHTATLLYDSAQHYNPGSYNDQGNTFPLNGSGVFTDTLTGDTGNAANAISYQVKIYAIS